MASILDILGNVFKGHVKDVRTQVKATNFANDTLKAMGFKARALPEQVVPQQAPPPAPGVKNAIFDLVKSVPRAAVAAGNATYESVPKILNALDRASTPVGGRSFITGYQSPITRREGEGTASLVARATADFNSNIWTPAMMPAILRIGCR